MSLPASSPVRPAASAAPEPPDELAARVRAAYRAEYRPSPWKVFWMTRVSVPAPALAVLAILILALGVFLPIWDLGKAMIK